MNIGGKASTVSLASTSQQSFASGSVLGSAFGAVAKSFMAAGVAGHEKEMAEKELEKVLRERERAQMRTVADVKFTTMMGEQDRALLDSQQDMAPGGRGLTTSVADSMPKAFDEFAKRSGISDDPELMDEYRPRWEAFAQDHITKAYGLEVEESNRYVSNTVLESLDDSMARVHARPENFDIEFTRLSATIDKSDLPDVVKEGLKTQAYNQLAGALMVTESQKAAADMLPVRLPDGKDVVAPGMSAVARAFLNATTSYEAGGDYGIRYDGKAGTVFSDFSDHPRVRVKLPNGEYSTAAGRYQIVASTWDATVKEMNEAGYDITDFSPVNQDRVAWYLAQKDYMRATGRNLEEVLSNGTAEDIDSVRQSLIGTWEGFGSDDAARTFVDRFLNGVTLGGNGHSEAPDPWTDPRLAGLPYAAKLSGQQEAQQLLNEARKQREAAAVEADKARTEALLLDLAKGVPGAEERATAALDRDEIASFDNVSRLETATKQYQTERDTTRGVATQLLDGKTLGPAQAADLDTYYKWTKVTEGLQGLDPTARNAFTQTTVKQGMIPPAALSVLQGQLNSGSAKDRAYAMSIMADIYEQNPAAFSSLPKEAQQQVILAHTLMKYEPDAARAGDLFGQMQTAEHTAMAEVATKKFDTAYEKDGGFAFFKTVRTTLDARGWSDFSVKPDMPDPTANTLARFQSNYLVLFRENLGLAGTEEAAHKMTLAMMKDVWSQGPFNGQFMEMSPLAPGVVKRAASLPPALPGTNPIALNGSTDWIEETIARQLGNPTGRIAIAADPQTLADVKKLGHPTYVAFIYDENGLITKAPLRVNVEMSPEVLRRELEQKPADTKAAEVSATALLFGEVRAPEQRPDLAYEPQSIWPKVGASIEKAFGKLETALAPLAPKAPPAAPNKPRDAVKRRAVEQAAISAKRLRDSAIRQIRRDNVSVSQVEAERLYDIYQIAKEQNISTLEASKIYDRSK